MAWQAMGKNMNILRDIPISLTPEYLSLIHI